VRSCLENVERGAENPSEGLHARVTSATLLVTIAAFGDAVIGDNLRSMVGRERSAVRGIIADLLPFLLAPA
jgi:hypothetical protein